MTPSQKLQAFLDSEGVVLLDGGLATALENKGVTLHPSLWSAYSIYESPEKITEVHLDYLQAGAQIITTSSYQVISILFPLMRRQVLKVFRPWVWARNRMSYSEPV
jgi:S-methylmethionine-dependent homocysteine/selenocysteine methylase